MFAIAESSKIMDRKRNVFVTFLHMTFITVSLSLRVFFLLKSVGIASADCKILLKSLFRHFHWAILRLCIKTVDFDSTGSTGWVPSRVQ